MLLNNGDGTYQAGVNYAAGDACSSVFAADLDGDNSDDLAVTNCYSDNVSVLLNCGAPTCDCPFQSDFDADGFLTALDLGWLIDVVFGGGPEIQDPDCPTSRGDFDNDGFPTTLDIAGLIGHLFVGGPPPCDPCDPIQNSCAK